VGRLRIDRITGPPAVLSTRGGRIVSLRCHTARSRLARLVGLLATGDLAAGEAVWIERCASVHAFGLRARIACAFVDADGRVLRIVDPLRRGRVASARGACAVVECSAGALAGVAVHDVLRRS
jgi:uncharacterized membrane protein (UPF0127 family)